MSHNSDDSSLDQAYTKFLSETKIVKAALQKWVVIAQSSSYISSMLTALVSMIICSKEKEKSHDASDAYVIPTLDGYICNLKTKVIRKRNKTDL